jgi:hypothetical protein
VRGDKKKVENICKSHTSLDENKRILIFTTKACLRILKAMHNTNVNFVIKDLMGKQILTGILSQFMREINHMKETF